MSCDVSLRTAPRTEDSAFAKAGSVFRVRLLSNSVLALLDSGSSCLTKKKLPRRLEIRRIPVELQIQHARRAGSIEPHPTIERLSIFARHSLIEHDSRTHQHRICRFTLDVLDHIAGIQFKAAAGQTLRDFIAARHGGMVVSAIAAGDQQERRCDQQRRANAHATPPQKSATSLAIDTASGFEVYQSAFGQ